MRTTEQLMQQVEAMLAEATRLREGAARMERQCHAILATPEHTAEQLRAEEAKRQAVLARYQPKNRATA